MGTKVEEEWKKGSADLLILSLLEDQQRHGYEIAKLIEVRSGGALHFHVASLYPSLYRLEKRGWIQGRWVEKSNQRRRRYYRLTAEGQRVLGLQRKKWQEFAGAVGRVAGVQHA
ncbi:MAG TPA: PadR family transcriptional regulator [Candidatus Acidoferrum sp.]|nr:PadR family transcriptional regulator [Candidatus Acidoferrum sp.]